MHTITRADLADRVHQELAGARPQAASLVETILGVVGDTLANGESVKLSGFGAFELRDKSARLGRNPKTGKEVPITPRRVLVFKASPVLKDRVADAPPSEVSDDAD